MGISAGVLPPHRKNRQPEPFPQMRARAAALRLANQRGRRMAQGCSIALRKVAGIGVVEQRPGALEHVWSMLSGFSSATRRSQFRRLLLAR